MRHIGKKIRQLREEKGMTQEELAHKVGYKSRVSINKIELQRDIPIKKISAIAKALDVTPSALMEWPDVRIEHKDLDSDYMTFEVTHLSKDHRKRLEAYYMRLMEMMKEEKDMGINNDD